MPDDRDELTRLIRDATDGDEVSSEALLTSVYDDLRALAGSAFRGQPGRHTLQPTALANEAYLRLVDRTGVSWTDRSHFFALSAVIMRGILADHARRRAAVKRGGDRQRVTLSGLVAGNGREVDLLALDEALVDLAKVSARQARVVEYRFFGGLTVEKIADLLGISLSTAEADWRIARAWLATRLSNEVE